MCAVGSEIVRVSTSGEVSDRLPLPDGLALVSVPGTRTTVPVCSSMRARPMQALIPGLTVGQDRLYLTAEYDSDDRVADLEW